MDITTLAALVFCVAAIGVIGFQVALALGAPWGAYAMGGTFPERLPPAMRVAAVVQAVAIAFLALIVLSAAGLASPSLVQELPWLVWLPVAFSAVSLGLNAASRSAGERRIWVPVALVLLASSLAVALTGR
jgi:cytochrome bd-type quinol oxidase subunit 2